MSCILFWFRFKVPSDWTVPAVGWLDWFFLGNRVSVFGLTLHLNLHPISIAWTRFSLNGFAIF